MASVFSSLLPSHSLLLSRSKENPQRAGRSIESSKIAHLESKSRVSIDELCAPKRRDVLLRILVSSFSFPILASDVLAETDVQGSFRTYEDGTNKFRILVPQDWSVGAADTQNIKSVTAFYPEEASDSNVSIVITGVGPDFTSLKSFGSVDAFAENLVSGLDRSWKSPPGLAAKLIDCKSANGLYYVEYTLQNPGESRRHLFSAIGMASNGWYNRLYTVTGQFVENVSEKYQSEIEKRRALEFYAMGFLQLLVTASVPVLNVLLVTGVGSFIATNYAGILPEDARKHLNNVVFYVFNPALVATNLSRTITLDSMLLMWFMPINVLLTFIFGSVLGWIVIQITKTPPRLRGLILGCCSAGNLGNLLLIIIPAICKEKASPFGAPDVCHTYGLAYASLSMALGAIFLWSYVYNIVRVTSTATEEKENARNSTPAVEDPEESAKLIPESCKMYSTSVDSTSGSQLQIYISEESSAEKKGAVCKVRRIMSLFSGINFKRLFAPSTIAVIVGFIVGLVPQIREALIGENAPLRVIQDSVNILGDGAIPTVTLIMGGNLIKGLRVSGIRFSLIFGVLVVRYFLLPLIGIVIVKGAIRLGLVHADPLYQFVLLVQYCLPPAMNIGTITQLFGAGENECSVIFLWAYALASVSLTLWSILFMWLVS